MKVIHGLRHIKRPRNGSCVTVGVFDGVHVGHRRIIKTMVSDAAASDLTSVILTFDPHPSSILNPKIKTPSLISLNHRIRLAGELGADLVVVLKFTKALAGMQAAKFTRDVLVGKLGTREICVGENFYFGRGAAAGAKVLKKIAGDTGIAVKIVKPVIIGAKVVSSSLIRHAITTGNLREAGKLLGRPVSILGTVVTGARIARELGYPTANVNPHHEVIPPSGVYAVRANLNGRTYGGVLNIGVRPTFYAPRDQEPAIEVHLFNFDGRIYGKDIEIFFIKRLRGELRFKSSKELIEQIKRDTERAGKIL